MWVQSCKPHNIWETLGLNALVRMPKEEEEGKKRRKYVLLCFIFYIHSIEYSITITYVS